MKCFYHNDMDGRGAASIVARYWKDYNRDDFFEVEYSRPWPLDKVADGEVVWFVDLSFKESTMNQLRGLLDRGCKVTWIDHHTSSINLENMTREDYAWIKQVPGMRMDGISGCALTYMYIVGCDLEHCPYYVKLVSDYDCWHYAYDPDTTYFKLGLETEAYDALDNVWKNLADPHDSPIQVKLLLERGKYIKQYIDASNKFYRDSYAYESRIAGYQCIVVNKKTNSWVFGDWYKMYPICVVWVFDGEKYSYSIYSSHDDIDCSKIAESLGGGGHFSAAGFTANELLFKKEN